MDNKTFIRGLDKDLYREVKADAARKGITLGQWFNEGMRLKLGICPTCGANIANYLEALGEDCSHGHTPT